MHSYSIPSILFALTLTALFAWPAAPAAGQPRDLAALAPAPDRTRIQIQPAALEPERIEAAAARGFELANASTALARVEFQLRRGEGLTCVTEGEAPVTARKFVVRNGASLVCDSAGERLSRLDYEVFRNVRLASGGFRQEHSKGRIELR
jgi:hypothetical protein